MLSLSIPHTLTRQGASAFRHLPHGYGSTLLCNDGVAFAHSRMDPNLDGWLNRRCRLTKLTLMVSEADELGDPLLATITSHLEHSACCETLTELQLHSINGDWYALVLRL